MSYIERLYIKILNTLAEPVKGIQRKNLICAVLLHIIAFSYLYYRFQAKLSPDSFFVFSGEIFAAVIAISLLLLAIFSVKKEVEQTEGRSIATIIYLILAICLTINGILKPQAPYASVCLIAYIFILPLLYIAWNSRRDYDLLFRMTATAFVNIGVIFYIVNFIFFPRELQEEPGPYMGATGNPNTLGIVCLSIFVCAVYMYIVSRKMRIFYVIAAAYSFGMIIVCQARTSMIAGVLAIAAAAVYYIRQSEIFEKKSLRRILVMACLAIALAAGIFAADMISKVTPPVAYAEENSESAIQSFADKFKIRSGGLNSMLSQRVELWEYYGGEISLLGHSREEYIKETARDNVTLAPHNTLIATGYFYGAPTMIAALISQVYVMVCVFKKIVKKKTGEKNRTHRRSVPHIYRDEDSFTIMTAIVFCSAGLVEGLEPISLFGVTGLFYISLAGIVSKKFNL